MRTELSVFSQVFAQQFLGPPVSNYPNTLGVQPVHYCSSQSFLKGATEWMTLSRLVEVEMGIMSKMKKHAVKEQNHHLRL